MAIASLRVTGDYTRGNEGVEVSLAIADHPADLDELYDRLASEAPLHQVLRACAEYLGGFFLGEQPCEARHVGSYAGRGSVWGGRQGLRFHNSLSCT